MGAQGVRYGMRGYSGFRWAAVLAVIVVCGVVRVAIAQRQGDAERGAKLYAENCVVCHGERGEGRVGATLRQNWPSIAPGALIREAIAQGVEGSLMPAWSQAYGGPLTEEDIDDIVAYIETWLTGGIPLPTLAPAPIPTAPLPAGVTGDPVAGAQIYVENCSMCHGPRGEGRTGATLARAWPAIQVGAFLRQTIANGVPNTLMPAWSQEKGGPLTDKEIDDVAAYLHTLEAAATGLPPPRQTGPGFLGVILVLIGVAAIAAIILAAIVGGRSATSS